MKILKIVFGAILLSVALLLITAAFVDKDYGVERSILVEQKVEDVYNYVKYMERQDYYSTWNLKDPDRKKSTKGTDGTVGFVYSWDSENPEVGKGELEITGMEENERIDMELRFYEPFEATDKAYFITKKDGEMDTLLTWGFKGTMPYPMNIMQLFVNMEEMLGPEMEESLDNLKILLE